MVVCDSLSPHSHTVHKMMAKGMNLRRAMPDPKLCREMGILCVYSAKTRRDTNSFAILGHTHAHLTEVVYTHPYTIRGVYTETRESTLAFGPLILQR